MKILGIVCSGRSEGNTETLVRRALDGAKSERAETEMWTSVGKNIKPCDHCKSCFEEGRCHIQDDMQELYAKMLEADGIVFGTPVYFWTVSAQAKLVIDRTYALRRPVRKLSGKLAGGIAVAARRGQIAAMTVLNNFFLGQSMIPVGLGIDGRGSEKGDIDRDETALNEAAEMGRKMAQMLSKR